MVDSAPECRSHHSLPASVPDHQASGSLRSRGAQGMILDGEGTATP